MILTPIQTIIIILAVTIGTIITRFLPFLMFPEGRKVPDIILFLGKMLPAAMMGLLVVYSLKNVSIITKPFGILELIAVLAVVFLHKWKGNVLLSVGIPTVLYMIMSQGMLFF